MKKKEELEVDSCNCHCDGECSCTDGCSCTELPLEEHLLLVGDNGKETTEVKEYLDSLKLNYIFLNVKDNNNLINLDSVKIPSLLYSQMLVTTLGVGKKEIEEFLKDE